MPRLHFDLTLSDGTVEQDSTGVRVTDVASAISECIDTVLAWPHRNLKQVSVRNEEGDVLVTIDVTLLQTSTQ